MAGEVRARIISMMVAESEGQARGSGSWSAHAHRALTRAGHRSSEPRSAVIDVLDRQECVRTPRAINDALRQGGRDIGIATVYRALELLHGMGLLRRLDVGDGPALYEPVDPSGEHHHHLVCERCGRVGAFEDEQLERAIGRLARRLDYEVGGHEVVLRGACPRCTGVRA
jgi:Fur family ferric uptake transcriptional regulator